MKKEEFDELLKEYDDSMDEEMSVTTDLSYLISKNLSPMLQMDEEKKQVFYTISINSLCNENIDISDVFQLFQHHWRADGEKLKLIIE